VANDLFVRNDCCIASYSCLLSRRSLSLTFAIASPNLFSPHSPRLASASAAPNPTPQIRSVGEACAVEKMSARARQSSFVYFIWVRQIRRRKTGSLTYFYQLPIARLEQFLRHPRAVFCAFGEFVVVAFFDDAGFICVGEGVLVVSFATGIWSLISLRKLTLIPFRS
jgi:hypothetical protein